MFTKKDIYTIIDNVNTSKLEFDRYKYIDNNPIEDGEIIIDSNIIEELEWVKTYLSDFYIAFKLINERNIYELIENDDSDAEIETKNNLYNTRMESIKPIKKAFVYYAINNMKRNKDNINNILTILDYYTRMRYYNNVKNDTKTSGYTSIGNRYKVITTNNTDRRVGEIFTETVSRAITDTNAVEEQFPLIYEKDVEKYIVKSYISNIEFDSVLKTAIVPIDWDFEYIQIEIDDLDLLFDVTYDTDNITRIGNAYYFDDISIHLNDISINNFGNNINSPIEREFLIT